MNQVIIVSHDALQNREMGRTICESGLTDNIKIAVNGGHALLHINQLHLNGKIDHGPILVLLNLNTPMINGFDFLTEFKETRNLKKENIHIVVIDHELTPGQKAKAEKLGVSYFVPLQFCPKELKKMISSDTSHQRNTPAKAA